MQTVYDFDATTGVPTGVEILMEGQKLNTDYQTTVVPPENKSVKFDKATQNWVTWTPPVDPVAAQLAELIKISVSQTSLNAQLIKQISALQAQITVPQQPVQTTNANTAQEAK